MAKRKINIQLTVDDTLGDDLIAHMLNTVMMVSAPYLATGSPKDFVVGNTRYERKVVKTAQVNIEAGAEDCWVVLATGTKV